MENFSAIPIFLAVADCAGFSPAAKLLGVSKSAVSKRISQLEEQLSARLFHRTTRKLSLTEAGERFYQYAIQANRSAQQAVDAVHELQGEPRGKLKVLLPMTIGQTLIAPLIKKFLALYPHLQIDLVLDDQAVNLIEQGYDLAVRAGELADSSLIARKIAPLHSVVCASESFLQEFEQQHNTQLNHPSLLAEANCLTYSYSTNADVWQFDAKENLANQLSDQAPSNQVIGKSIQQKISGNYRVNNSAALMQAVIAGMGVARLPTFLAGEAIRTGQLVALFPDYSMPYKNLYAVYPERQYLPIKVRVFLDFLIENLLDKNSEDSRPLWDQF